MHPFSAEETFGAESFEDYMCQFMCGDVKFEDFRKASIPKFDLSRNDSFVHWYKLFCSTCLQWGVWCPPYDPRQVVDFAPSVCPRERCIHVRPDLHRPQPRIHLPQWLERTGSGRRLPPSSGISRRVLPFSVAPPPSPFSLLHCQRDSPAKADRAIQSIHSPTSGFHGSRTPIHADIHRIRSS
jgi:hypothetical protein